MNKTYLFTVPLVLCGVLLGSVHSSGYTQFDQGALDSYVLESMKAWEVPGLAIAIVEGDDVVYAKGHGYCDLDNDKPVTPSTIFAIGSCTKSFTAAAVAMSVAEGGLDWDDKLVDLLPAFQLFDPYVTREVTVRDVLAHRCGLPHADHLWFGSTLDRDQIVYRMRLVEPQSSFRYTFDYSNNMYIVAGEIIRSVSGITWDEFMKARIFKPLGMTESTVSISAIADVKEAAVPYLHLDEKRVAVPWRNMDNAAPAGGINSNVVDMSRWLRLLLNDGVFEGQRILDSLQVEEIYTTQVVIHPQSPVKFTFPMGSEFLGYGLGWFVSSYHGHRVVEHAGGVDGMMAHVALVPDLELGIVVLSNMITQFLPLAISQWVIDRQLGLPETDWSTERLNSFRAYQQRLEAAEEEKEASRNADAPPSLLPAAYAGTYSHAYYGDVMVCVRADSLVFDFTPSFNATLAHWHHDTFKAVWPDRMMGEDFVTFVLGADGQAKKIEIERFGEFERSSD
jgi:CubicO group peptidase (beta-lactamase class C family)